MLGLDHLLSQSMSRDVTKLYENQFESIYCRDKSVTLIHLIFLLFLLHQNINI